MDTYSNFCTKCGGQIVNGVCTNCSNSARETFVQATAQQSAQSQRVIYNIPGQPAYQNPYPVNGGSLTTNTEGGVFISPDEHLLHKVGSGYVQNYLSGSGFSKDSAAVTNKRVYYKGKTYAAGLGFRRFKTTLVADLKDITCVGIYKSFDIFTLVISILMLLVGVFLAGRGIVGDAIILILILLAILGIICVILTARTVLKIDYAGGCIALDVKAFGEKELNDFRTALYRAKDAITDYNQK